jgi:hypothetical protein
MSPHPDSFQLRTFCYLDRLQPGYAAFLGTVAQGDLPVQGMASLFIEVAPGNEIFRLVDIAMKSTRARPGAQVVEREFGLFELHSHSQAEVQAVGQVVLDHLGLLEEDRIPPEIVSIQRIPCVDMYQSQLLNRFRRGATLVSGRTMLVVECAPAAYANFITNEIEKRVRIDVIHVMGLGRFGRVWLAGSEADMLAAEQAAKEVVASLQKEKRNDLNP